MIHFLSPALLAGVLAIGVPIALHLYGRRRAQPRPFAAVDFLLRTNQKLARSLELRRLLLLLARVAVALAIPLVLSRPFAVVSAEGSADLGGVSAAVIVLDDSLSTRAVAEGAARFEAIRRLAKDGVRSLPQGAELAVLSGAYHVTPPAFRLDTDRARILGALDDARPTFRGSDLDTAVQRAAALLAQSASGPPASRRILVVTDGSKHAWKAAPPAEVGGFAVEVVAPAGEPPKNHAIVDLRIEPAPDAGGRGARVVAVVAGSGKAEAGLEASLVVDGKVVARGLLDLPAGDAGRRVEKGFSLSFEPGVHEVEVRIPSDALPEDDRRGLRVELRRDVRVLLFDGDPRSVRREDELHFLETALRPGDDASSRMQVTTIAELGELPRRLADADVVFVCNPKALGGGDVAALRSFVERGGGLFLSFGDAADPVSLAGPLAQLLPQAPSGVRTENGAGERVARVDRTHPLFSTAFDAEAESLRQAGFRKYVLFLPAPKDPARRALVWLSGGAPLLFERDVGKGHVLAFASTIDLDWNDLPIRPGYLPLVQQAARHLARSPLEQPDAPVLVGARRELALGDDAAGKRVEVERPDGERITIESSAGGASFGGTDLPGLHRVRVDGKDRPELSFMVALDAAESDLTVSSAKADMSTTVAPARPRTRRLELWHTLAALLLAALFAESLLLRRG